MKRLAVSGAVLLALMAPASAMQCELVKAAVDTFGERMALQWAQARGWTPAMIADARKCLTKTAERKR